MRRIDPVYTAKIRLIIKHSLCHGRRGRMPMIEARGSGMFLRFNRLFEVERALIPPCGDRNPFHGIDPAVRTGFIDRRS